MDDDLDLDLGDIVDDADDSDGGGTDNGGTSSGGGSGDTVYEIPNYAKPGEPGHGWTYYSDGTTIGPDNTYYFKGEAVWNPTSGDLTGGSVLSKLGTAAKNALIGAFTKNGQTDWKAVASAAGGLYGLYQAQNPTPQPKVGYQGGIPEYTAIRQQVPGAYDPNRRPGSGGQRYFTDTTYAKAADVNAARTAAETQAAALQAANTANPYNVRPAAPAAAAAPATPTSGIAASQVINQLPVPTYAYGGIATLAKGGEPRYLSGGTDGMADKIAANIDGKQEARLSHGEFVIPADVVSHLGNGNSESGAQRLYSMMDRIRKARTGTTQQGKQINPDRFLPK